MEALGNIFGKIATGIGQRGGMLQNIMGGFGMGSNVLNQIMKWKAMSQAKAQQQRVADLAKNPSKLAAMAASAEQPLDQSLTRTVTDRTLADLAGRGLNPQTAPGQTQEAVAEAIAPWKQQNQAEAIRMVMSTLGLPFEQAAMLAQLWGSNEGSNTGLDWLTNLYKNKPMVVQGGIQPIPGGPYDPNNPANMPDPTAPNPTLPPEPWPDIATGGFGGGTIPDLWQGLPLTGQ